MRLAVVMLFLVATLPLRAADALQWSGFALLRGGSGTDGVPLDDDQLGAQVQLGIDWRPSMRFGGHLHLLARSDGDDSRRGRAGVVEAWLDQSLVRGEHRLRLMEGAFFLPTTRENVDALWETPYTITPSALNSWLGEELRPIGIDAAYTFRRQWTGGLTLFRGNDTLGALPADRGWALRDHWALLGEHLPVDEEYFTSVSAETDHRLGWAGRGRWNSDRSTAQITYLDNRSDALEHGELLNWATRFWIAGADYTTGDWTLAAESGWGETDVIVEGTLYTNELSTTYVLVSRRLGKGRASLRAEEFRVDSERRHALTAAYLWTPRAKLRAGVEVIVAGSERRVAVEMRAYF
jgi:hypothetical protein